MKKLSMQRYGPALAVATLLAGGAGSLAQSSRRATPAPRRPESRFQAQPDRYTRSYSDREPRALIEELENSSPAEVRAGRISRYFTDPAVIITNGRLHRIDWSRVRDDRAEDRYQQDRNNPDDRNDARRDRDDPTNQDRRDDRRPDARIESFQTRRIDDRTMVVLYTAVLPDGDGVLRQPVVATLVRESGSRGWRVASYTAENAAIPGGTVGAVEGDLRGR